MTLRWLKTLFHATFDSEAERTYFAQCQQRPLYSDAEFLQAFYAGSHVPRDIPLRLRRIFTEQLRYDKIIPTDNPCVISDVDICDIMLDIAEEFGFSATDEELRGLNGTFSSIVELVHKKRLREQKS